MIENYPNVRRRHCETGAFVSMMEFLGFEISEPMTFGIGSGLYFLYTPYLKMQNTIYPIFRAWPVTVTQKASKRLGLPYHETRFKRRPEAAAAELDALLAKGIPVGVVVNVNGLQYFNVGGGGIDFNGHILTVLGKEADTYKVADTDSRLANDDLLSIDAATLQSIRFAPGVAAPHGQMFHFDPLPEDFEATVDLRQAVKEGLKETCHNMLSIPFRYFGVRGVRYFANDMRRWEKHFTPKQIGYRMLWYYRVIERAGTGGAGYRFIYADFLKEASALCESKTLEESAAKMAVAADLWRTFSLDCRRFLRKDDDVSIATMAQKLDEISGYEKDVFMMIKNNFLK